jgi:hypothetical protein
MEPLPLAGLKIARELTEPGPGTPLRAPEKWVYAGSVDLRGALTLTP